MEVLLSRANNRRKGVFAHHRIRNTRLVIRRRWAGRRIFPSDTSVNNLDCGKSRNGASATFRSLSLASSDLPLLRQG